MGGALSAPQAPVQPEFGVHPEANFLEKGTYNATGFDFDGPASKKTMFQPPGASKPLVRSDSLNVINDPRIAQTNVISARLTYFSTISVAAALIATLAFTAISIVQPANDASDEGKVNFSYCNFIALTGMSVALVANMFTVVVLTHQMYIVGRMLTAGPLGFEMGKSLYLNKNITTLRHVAVQSFFRSIPLFLISAAFMVYQMVCPSGDWFRRILACIAATLFVVAGVFIAHVYLRQRSIFKEKTTILVKYEHPMHAHMGNLSGPLSPRHFAD